MRQGLAPVTAPDHGRDVITGICARGRDMVAAGLVVASGGNISAREPDGDTCWITAAGTWLDRLEPGDCVEVRLADGQPVDPTGPAPSTELALHVATYAVRPDVHAVVHLHPQFAILLDVVGEPIRLITTDHLYYLRRIARTPFHPPNSPELAQVAAAAAADGTDCVLLAHHGCSVLGPDLTMAGRRALNLEEAARLTYHALLLGRETPGPPWDLPKAGLI
jgi:L-fuculose-phosphate aldolase